MMGATRRSKSLRSSNTHSHHTNQETHNFPAASATLSPPCALSTSEHRLLQAPRTRPLAQQPWAHQTLGLAHHSREVPSQSRAQPHTMDKANDIDAELKRRLMERDESYRVRLLRLDPAGREHKIYKILQELAQEE
ncbi:hypothetical protein LTR01_009053 [Friedmanniomyces endolithicus]|nr:hypothetical protein LTR01_009053 [Friedmanniomyces endolithicus]